MLRGVETRFGFDDNDFLQKVKGIPFLRQQVEVLASQGFRYVGDTLESNPGSKAYINPAKKWIFIGRKTTMDEAVLSLSYEMINAKNSKELTKLYEQYSADAAPSRDRAASYAKGVLRIEAQAVYARSRTAIECGQESMVKNKEYLEIVRKQHDKLAAEEEIFNKMLENGTVHNGSKKAFDHYVDQYWDFTLD